MAVLQIVHLIEGQHERATRRRGQPRQRDEDLLDLLVVGQGTDFAGLLRPRADSRGLLRVERFARQPANRQRRGRAVVTAFRRLTCGAKELEQYLVHGSVDGVRARQVGSGKALDADHVNLMQPFRLISTLHAAHGFQQPAEHQFP